jgi:type IV secretion system protein TrbL
MIRRVKSARRGRISGRPPRQAAGGSGASRPDSDRNRRRLRRPVLLRLLFAVVAVALVAGLVAPTLAAQSIVNGMAEQFRESSMLWTGRLLRNAQRVFVLLAGFEVVASALILLLKPKRLDEAGGAFVLKILVMSVCFLGITSFELVVPPIYETFVHVGQSASIVPSLNPGQVSGIGIATAGQVMLGGLTSWGALSPNFLLGVLIVAFIIVLCFAAIACQIVYTLVEGYVVMSAGIFYLGFASFRGTAQMADNYIMYLVYVGTKLFMLYLLVPIGVSIAMTWKSQLENATILDFTAPWEICIGALIFAGLVCFLPGSFANRITSGANLGIAQALRSN